MLSKNDVILNEHESIEAITAVLKKEPFLHAAGFGVDDSRKKTREAVRHEIAISQQELFKHWQQFSAAVWALSQMEASKTVTDRSPSAYGMKHQIARRLKHLTAGGYISSGALVAAAIHLGFPYRNFGSGALIGVSQRSYEMFADGLPVADRPLSLAETLKAYPSPEWWPYCAIIGDTWEEVLENVTRQEDRFLVLRDVLVKCRKTSGRGVQLSDVTMAIRPVSDRYGRHSTHLGVYVAAMFAAGVRATHVRYDPRQWRFNVDTVDLRLLSKLEARA